MRKLTLLAGVGIGYVLGSRAGRERYEQIKSKAQQTWQDPRVQEKAAAAQDLVEQNAPKVADKAGQVASDLAAKVKGSDDASATTPGSDTAPQPVVRPETDLAAETGISTSAGSALGYGTPGLTAVSDDVSADDDTRR